MRRTQLLGLGSLLAMGMAGLAAAAPASEDHTPGQEPRRLRHKPSGSTPVPGGGQREQVRRISRQVRKWISSRDLLPYQGESPGVSRDEINRYVAQAYPDLPPHIHHAVVEAAI